MFLFLQEHGFAGCIEDDNDLELEEDAFFSAVHSDSNSDLDSQEGCDLSDSDSELQYSTIDSSADESGLSGIEEITETQPKSTEISRKNTSAIVDLPTLEASNISNITQGCPKVGDSIASETSLERTSQEVYDMAMLFGFQQYIPPAMLCRHPPPAIGRDDDKYKLREILDDILSKLAHDPEDPEKILFAPDHKIGKNLFELLSEVPKYRVFTPEFPLLHLRKSMINILGSAYKDAGIKELLKYMKDDSKNDEWTKLITAANIDAATKIIRRLALALHLAFLVSFLDYLPMSTASSLLDNLLLYDSKEIATKWHQQFLRFVATGCKKSPNFVLHWELLQHCDEVMAISFAERLGGPQGYKLLVATIKSSLPFSFLNGASSYAAYCTDLLYHHSSVGPFHRNMKMSLFTNPHNNSEVNFALDSQREMDHKDSLKAFRPRATLSSVIPRMSLVDDYSVTSEQRASFISGDSRNSTASVSAEDNYLNKGPKWSITENDMKHIVPTAMLVLRRGGLALENNDVLSNVYAKTKTKLPAAHLDKDTYDVGKFLIRKYAATKGLFGLTAADNPTTDSLSGPAPLISKVRRGKSTTVKRTTGKQSVLNPSEREKKELARQRKVKREKKVVDCYSSDMNTCQSLVKPDCSKPTVQKSKNIKTALRNLIDELCTTVTEKPTLIYNNLKDIPQGMLKAVKAVTVEFAGVKFSTHAHSGEEYLSFVERSVIKKILSITPNTARITICEEKYSFTPDDFKSATRVKRQKKGETIAHLKTQHQIVSHQAFDKQAVVTTMDGKIFISTYLAANVSKLQINRPLTLDIESEFCLVDCECNQLRCSCEKAFAAPLSANFNIHGFQHEQVLHHIHQRKGEAEMSQVDWLPEYVADLKKGDAIMALVTSGDIDAVVIHLFALAHMWHKEEDGSYTHPVYVYLQRPGDLFDITGILTLMEKHFEDPDIGMKVSVVLSMGGNDFIPKYQGISHDKILKAYLADRTLLDNLIAFDRNGQLVSGRLNRELYQELVKKLFTPARMNPSLLSVQQVHQISVLPPGDSKPRNPQKWMPPPTVLLHLANLIQCQIDYLSQVGCHDSLRINFMNKQCLKRNETGEVEFDFGVDSHIERWEDLLKIPTEELKVAAMQAKVKVSRKRNLKKTPKKGRRKKVVNRTSTPK